MPLLKDVIVQYSGNDKILTDSPVFDILNLPMQGNDLGLVGRPGILVVTFFLVFSNIKQSSLMWVNMKDCKIVNWE